MTASPETDGITSSADVCDFEKFLEAMDITQEQASNGLIEITLPDSCAYICSDASTWRKVLRDIDGLLRYCRIDKRKEILIAYRRKQTVSRAGGDKEQQDRPMVKRDGKFSSL